jgi:hypothetical protein
MRGVAVTVLPMMRYSHAMSLLGPCTCGRRRSTKSQEEMPFGSGGGSRPGTLGSNGSGSGSQNPGRNAPADPTAALRRLDQLKVGKTHGALHGHLVVAFV